MDQALGSQVKVAEPLVVLLHLQQVLLVIKELHLTRSGMVDLQAELVMQLLELQALELLQIQAVVLVEL
jgi:hypothetical protein